MSGDAEFPERRAVREAAEALRAAAPRLHDAVIAAARAGVRQADIVLDSGYSREQVRRILREAGIGPSR
ncbi:hypothetical protein [Longispora albida]|uniref:hypothetical protein n=1 Tax=Longispora albida TaxID=203523 RepID=UPI000381A8B4|nr:hypothetical protein [Longispora albida]